MRRLFIWGVTDDIAINEYHVYSRKINNPFTVAQISDVHFGLSLVKEKVEKVVRALVETDTDIVVSTGDFMSMCRVSDRQRIMMGFRTLLPKCGMFAVLGGHEFHYDIRFSLETMRQCGFVVLRNILTRVKINDNMVSIVGLEDNLPIPFHGSPDFSLVLKHVPMEPEFRYDLMLSGHTHDGQGFPPVEQYYRRLYGKARTVLEGKNGRMFISPGTGTWGPPVRLCSPPEVSVFRIMPQRA